MRPTVAAPRLTYAILLALSVFGSAAIAAVDSGIDMHATAYDSKVRDFDTQMRNVLNTPVDFCDPVAMEAQGRDYSRILAKKIELKFEREKIHPSLKQDAKSLEDAIDDDYADDFFWNFDPQIVKDYESALKRQDMPMANEYQHKMTPWEKVKAADDQKNFVLEIKLLTPLADKGDVNAQQRLAFMYTWGKTLDDAKIVTLPVPAVRPSNNEALAFKYYQMAARNGDETSQEGLANAYACGLGTSKNLVKAYAWFSLSLAQSSVMLRTSEKPEEILRKRDFLVNEMSHDDIQRAKHLIIQCSKSRYKDCNSD